MQVRGCPERPDGHAGVRELKEELEARDQRQRPAQQGMAAPEAARRDPGAIVRGILQSHR